MNHESAPRACPQLTSSLLEAMRALHGEGGISRVFEKRMEGLKAQYRACTINKDLAGWVEKLAQVRAEERYMADWEKRDEDTW